ncbi:MAG: hypothetical protein GX410_05990 [Elusimicrobia bacterium]|nr:hypothetical protein [Elusimicrobiota bacterium]
MKKTVLCLGLLLCLGRVSCAQEEPALQNDAILRAMQDEMSRTVGILRLDQLEKPYYAAYTVWDGTSSFVEAGFGAVLSENMKNRYRRASAEVLVGDYAFDNSKFNYQRPNVSNVAQDAGYDGVRFTLWSMSDGAYKDALEAFSRKKAFKQMKSFSEMLQDRTTAQAFRTYVPQEQALPDDAQLRGLAERLSAVFKKYPQVQESRAALWFAAETQRYLNSEGTEFMVKDTLGQLALRAEGQAQDGFPIKSGKDIFFMDAASIPSVDKLEEEADRLGREIEEFYKSGTIDAYIGPVLLEGPAAGEFFFNLFVANVSNPREEWLSNGVDERMGQLAPKLGLRVLPAFLDVYDDPSQKDWKGEPLIGSYKVDDEGVPAQRVALAKRGKLLDVYMSRSPIKGKNESNGHGRASFRRFASGQPGNVFVSARRESGCVLPAAKLRQRLARMCREMDLEYGIVIRAFDSFSRESAGYEARFAAYKVYASDGHEEPVHGLEIVGLVPAALRAIEAVSAESYVSSYFNPVPVSIVAPAMLLGDVEVRKSLVKPDRKPYLENPYFAERQGAVK